MYLLNGESKRCVDVADRGFQYGDGLFETLLVERGKPLFLDRHLDRLRRGCDRLLIPVPDRGQLQREALQMSAGADRAVLKLIVTRGQGGRGYRLPEDIRPTRLLSLYPFPDYPDHFARDGVSVRFCRLRLGMNPDLAGIKHLNRLEQIMARAEWREDDIQEGLMRDQSGSVIEGTMSNVFFVENGTLKTAPIERCGVAGIVREIMMQLAGELAIDVCESYYSPERLLKADEIFVTNSVIGLWPVNRLEKLSYAVGSITRTLQKAYRELADREIEHA